MARTSTTPTTPTSPPRWPWRGVLRRWPTAAVAGLGLAALLAAGLYTSEGVTDLAQAALLLPLEYLLIAKLRRRRASWPVIAALFLATVTLDELDVVDPTLVLAALALAVLVWGAVDGRLGRRPDPFRVQALGMVGFGALALAGLVAAPALGRFRVAAAWLLHVVWISSTSGSTGWWPAPTQSSVAWPTSWSRPGWSCRRSHATATAPHTPTPSGSIGRRCPTPLVPGFSCAFRE